MECSKIENILWNYEPKGEDNLMKQFTKDNSIIFTNPEMAKYLLSRIDFKEGDVIMEPGRGAGSFYNNLPEFTINKWCEINEGIDYLTQN